MMVFVIELFVKVLVLTIELKRSMVLMHGS